MPGDTIKAKIVFDTSALTGLGGKLGAVAGGPGMGGALGGLAKKGDLLKAGALAGAVAAGVTALLSVVKKGFSVLKEASPQLAATFKIFGKSLMLILRPIADVMNLFLRPFAIGMLHYVIKFYRNWKENYKNIFDGLKGFFGRKKKEGQVGEEGDPIGIASTEMFDKMRKAVDESSGAFGKFKNIIKSGINLLETLTGVFKIVWGIIKGLAGTAIILGKVFLFLLEKALGPLQPIMTFLADVILTVGEFFSDIGTAIWDLATGGSWDAFITAAHEAFGKLIEGIGEAFQKMMVSIGKNIVEQTMKIVDGIKSAWGVVKTFFVETVPGWILGAWDAVENFFTETIPGWFESIGNAISNMISRIKSLIGFGGRGGGAMSDGIITPSGEIIRTHPQDFIIATKNPGRLFGGGGSNVTINLSALDAGSIDNQVIDRITRAVEEGLKRSFSSRTMEASGI